MFIEITNPANPIKTALFLMPYQRGEKTFTPEVAHQILTMTNQRKNIFDMLSLIAKLPQEEQAQYKEIILSTVDHRDQTPANKEIISSLANENGYLDELNTLITQMENMEFTRDDYYLSAVHDKAIILSDNINAIEFQKKFPPNSTVLLTNTHNAFSKVHPNVNFRFKPNTKVGFMFQQKLPKLDCSPCNEVQFTNCNLEEIKNLNLKNIEEIEITWCSHLSFKDFPHCNNLTIKTCSLKNNSDFNFCNNITLTDCTLEENTDLSSCDHISLKYCDLSKIKNIKFKPNATVLLEGISKFPPKLDLSNAQKVEINSCDFRYDYTIGAPDIWVKNRNQIIFNNNRFGHDDIFVYFTFTENRKRPFIRPDTYER